MEEIRKILRGYIAPQETGFDPAAHDDYSPNEVQLELLRLIAEKYWYVGISDTEHDCPHLQAHAFNKKTVSILANAGKQHYFVENPRNSQSYLDAASSQITGSLDRPINQWLNERDYAGVSEIFERSAKDNTKIKFIAGDLRQEDPRYVTHQELIQSFVLEYQALEKSYKDRGIEVPDEMVDEFVARVKPQLEASALSMTSDETPTVEFIESFRTPSVIRFGGAHFAGVLSPDKSMRHLLTAHGRSLCVIDVFENTAALNEYNRELNDHKIAPIPPDVRFYLVKSFKHPHGVKIVNPALGPLYKQALQNCGYSADGSSPSLTT